MSPTTLTLLLTAGTLGAVHALAPDHWLPFATLGRAHRLDKKAVLRLTLVGGLAHLLATTVLALAAISLGREAAARWGGQLAGLATYALIVLGLSLVAWALHRRTARQLADTPPWSQKALILLFAADPCVALLPLLAAAATQGVPTSLAVGLVYGVATLTTMATAATFALGTLEHLPAPSPLAAGTTLALTGALVLFAGI